jgi:hypothetical protein
MEAMKYIRYGKGIYRIAQEPEKDVVGPSEEEMVDEIEDTPASRWREYLQPIIRLLKQQLGIKVHLLGPQQKNPYGATQYGFSIEGHLKFPEGLTPELSEQFGDAPISFRAYIDPSGELTPSIEVY